MLKIAVVEDHDDLREAVVAALAGEGHLARGLDCAEALVEEADIASLDLLVVDLMLPGEDGISLTRRVRAARPQIGIVMLTARTGASDRKLGYKSGADLYLTKPASLDELCAAVNSLSRRLEPSRPRPGIVVEPKTLLLRGPGGEQRLSAQEAALLAGFAVTPDRRLEARQIVEIAGRADGIINRNTVNVTIFRLAAKLRQAGAAERPIRAIRNWGYQLCEEITLG